MSAETETLPAEVAEKLEINDEANPEPSATKPEVSYPLKVQYCGECTMPLEYCSFSGRYDQCKVWREKNSEQLAAENIQIVDDDDAAEGKKHRKRGGKGLPKAVKVCFRVFKNY
jgi:hypothetical protein